MTEDDRYMRIALQIAELGRSQTSPNPMVGAVIVRDGEVVGQGAHLKAGTPHAEVHALRMAGDKARGATAYVTLEPCSHFGRTPPCCDALIAAGVQRVVIGMVDPNPDVAGEGIRRLRAAGVQVAIGVCEAMARAQNEAYLAWRRERRAFVVYKGAVTLDGYIATASGHSSFVTGAEARADVQELRRSVSAIGVGIGTVIADDPRLTVRPADQHRPTQHDGEIAILQPLRVVFDSQLRIPSDARCLREPGMTVVYTTESGLARRQRDAAGLEALKRVGAEVAPISATEDGRVCLRSALRDLAARGRISVLVEGGARIAASLLRERLVDKVVYYIAPKLLGGGLPAVAGGSALTMADAVELDRVSWTQVGVDVRVTGYPRYGDSGQQG